MPFDLWICVALFVTTLAVYWPVRQFEFVGYDDPGCVDNELTRKGITGGGLVSALTTSENSNWLPLTRMSHMLDHQLFGAQSGWHHLTSVVIHALAALMLFEFLRRATGARGPSAFVAFCFALHPLHVESVAWVAERKDVLNALFWFATLWAYVRYAERPGRSWYLATLGFFCLGALSKPMIVTLPCVMLLLDLWPLERLRFGDARPNSIEQHCAPIEWKAAVWEKVPFFVLATVVAVVTYLVQKSSGAVARLEFNSPGERVCNAVISYAMYIAKMFWPTKLAVLYPYPSTFVGWQVALSVLLLAAISGFVVRVLRTAPWLAVGWFWYLGTLVPVIGLVQVGDQARADRYTYVPLVGIAIMLGWTGARVERVAGARTVVRSMAVAVCLAMAAVTFAQLKYWRNSISLFERAIAVTEDNYLMHDNLGVALRENPDRVLEAIAEHRAALKIKPDFAPAHVNLGVALAKVPGRMPEAIAEWETAVRIRPDSALAHNNLGLAFTKMPGRMPEAIAEFEAALRADPDYANAHGNLGVVLSQTPGRMQDAIRELEIALRLRPDPRLRQLLEMLRAGVNPGD